MRSVLMAMTIGVLGAQTAWAGAWLREEGKLFASTSATTNQSRDAAGSFYAEYGWRQDLTLGADFSFGLDRTGQQTGSGVIFARFPLAFSGDTHKWAAHVGLGGRYINGLLSPAFETGLSWGRGFQWQERYGWVNIDSSINIPGAPAQTRIKLDGTIGLGFTDHIKAMGQVFMTYENNDLFTKFAPSLLVSPKSGAYTIQLGAEIPMTGGGETALKIGFWQSF